MKQNCKKCKNEFLLIKQELNFYRKMGFPNPQNCPNCRQERRLKLRNERKFYKYPCAKCNKDMVSTINPDSGNIVYCIKCYSDFRANVDLTK